MESDEWALDLVEDLTLKVKNDVLMAVNVALKDVGVSIARSTVAGEDAYSVIRIPTVRQSL